LGEAISALFFGLFLLFAVGGGCIAENLSEVEREKGNSLARVEAIKRGCTFTGGSKYSALEVRCPCKTVSP
jgi:hypothetical protein